MGQSLYSTRREAEKARSAFREFGPLNLQHWMEEVNEQTELMGMDVII